MQKSYPIIAALVALSLFSIVLIFPFFHILVLSAIMAYIMYPMYKKIDMYVPRYAAIISCIFLISLFTLPLLLLLQSLVQESISIINIVRSLISRNQSTECTNFLCEQTQLLLQQTGVNQYIQGTLDNMANVLIQQTSVFLGNLPEILLQIVIFFFAFYYAIKDGKNITKFIDRASKQIQSVFTVHLRHMDSVMRAILFGYFLVALVQGVIALVGYIVLGIENAFFWAALTSIFALIPIIGTAIVWFPLSVMQIIEGVGANDLGVIVKGVILLLYGLFIISTIDNFIRPGIIAARVNVHPLTIFLGILGGIKILGPAGFIIGPVILSTTIRMVQDTVNQ